MAAWTTNYLLRFGGQVALRSDEVSPSRRIVFMRYADEELPGKPGPYRWVIDMAYADENLFEFEMTSGTGRSLVLPIPRLRSRWEGATRVRR